MILGLAKLLSSNVKRQTSTDIDKYKKEFWKLVRFGMVGVSTFAFQFILYFIFSRFLMPDISRSYVYYLVMGFTVAENYSAHRLWTFKDHAIPKNSMGRYIIVAVLATALNAGLFWLGHNVFKVYDLIMVFLAGLAVPLFTYAGHRWYTFKQP
jgi:putative flippase GtrA